MLYYEDLPMVVVNVLLATKVFELGGLLEDNPTTIYIGLTTTIINIIVSFVIQSIESGASDVSFMQLSIENMTARISWIPFQKTIVQAKYPIYIDYGMIDAPISYLSHRVGFYKRILFQFNR